MSRTLGWLLTLLAVVIWGTLHFDDSARRPELSAYVWRRTSAGWEHTARWRPPAADDPTVFHPLMLAAVQLSACLLALSAIPEESFDDDVDPLPSWDRTG